MQAKRQWQPTKAAWAATQAALRRQQASHLRAQLIPGSNWRAVRAKMRGLAALQDEAAKFERMAERFRARGQ